MTAATQEQIELSAVLNLVPYLDVKMCTDAPLTLQDIVDKYESTLGHKEEFKLLKQFVEDDRNKEYAKIELVNQSSTNDTSTWTDDLIQGCTFRDPSGNYYVAFRGTGDGRWKDNADGMVAPNTEMQRAAADYFDQMAEEYLIKASNDGKKIIVTGHSKGGNEAQYVYMAAKHEEIINACISVDGQGFSGSAVENFEKRHGDNYEEKLQNMYSVNGENDFVHDLGYTIIPEENTYFVPTSSSGKIPANLHALQHMLMDDNGKYTGLRWAMEGGRIVNGEQGPVGQLVKEISKEMMKMDDEDLNGAALIIMDLIDPCSDETCLGDVKVSWTDWFDFLSDGVPVLLEQLLTPEGWAGMKEIATLYLEQVYREKGIGGVIGTIAVAAIVIVVSVVALIKHGLELAIIIDFISDLINSIDFILDFVEKLGKAVKEFVTKVVDAVVGTINKIGMKLRSYTKGYEEATANPQIILDTDKLESCADRIKKVQSRISKLDRRLDSLYWQVGLLDLWDLMQADLLTCRSWQLDRCVSYLNNTASDFRKAENDLLSKI